METVKLSTIIKLIDPELENVLTERELEMPVALRDGVYSVTNKDLIEIVEASIILKQKGAFFH